MILTMIVAAFLGLTARSQTANDELPTVEWAREVLRKKIAEYNGTPVDDYTPMPCVVIQWDQQIREIKGERCWFAMFKYCDKKAFLRGHGTTILQAIATSEGMITQSAEFTELQRQHAAQFEAQHPQPPMGDVYSKSGYGPGGALKPKLPNYPQKTAKDHSDWPVASTSDPEYQELLKHNTPKPGQLIRSPAIVYPTATTPQSVEGRRAEPVTTPTINPPDSVEIPSQRTLNGERYPQTRQRLLTLENIKGLSAAEVRYAINEIYARYGATFPNHPDVQQQFQKFDWYHPKRKLTFDDIDQLMSDIERENVKVLAQRRDTLTKH